MVGPSGPYTSHSRQGSKKFDAAARAASRHDELLYGCVNALLEAVGAIEAQVAAPDKRVGRIGQSSKPCWHLTSIPCVGSLTALAFIATIEDPGRFKRCRDVGAYLGMTSKRYQSGACDIAGAISKQGSALQTRLKYAIVVLG